MDITVSRFIQLFIAIVFGWVLISLWIQVINTFTYSYLMLDRNNIFTVFLIALIFSIIFVVYVFITPEEDVPEQVITRMSSITEFSNNGDNIFN